MDLMAIFILSLLSTFTANILNVSGISVRQKVSIIESKVKSLELLTSAHQTSFTEMADDIADVNTTMLTMCAVDGGGVHVAKQESQHVRAEPVYDPREFNARLVQAFQDEKEYVRKQEKNISDKTSAFLKAIMEKVTQHEQRITDISNEFLNEFNEKVADGVERGLTKVKTDIVELFSTTSALKASVNTQLSMLTNQVQKQLKTAEEKLAVLEQRSDELIANVNSHDESIRSLLTDVANIKGSTQELYNKTMYPMSWTKYGNFYYKYFDSRKTFAEARKICASHKAHVVDVASQPEMDFIMRLVTSSTDKRLWLGLTDSEREGTWKWDRTGAVATYLNWLPGQPDNYGGNRDCVIAGYRRRYDLWIDVQCSYESRFVCKSSIV